MIVRIRFGHGRLITHRAGKNSKAALLLASGLTLVSISFGVLGLWRLGEDLGFLGDFVFPTGLLSHWQVWIAAAGAAQYACWRLTRYSKRASVVVTTAPALEGTEQKTSTGKTAARV